MNARRGSDRIVSALLTATYVVLGAATFGLVVKSHGPLAPETEYQQLGDNLAGLPAGTYSVDGGHVVILGSVIRMGSPAPYIHANTAHSAVAVTAVGINANGDLLVTASPPEGAQIFYASADEDETLSRLGISCGVSGGGGTSIVKCYRAGKHVNADSPVYGTSGNIWYTLIMFVPNAES